VTKTLDAAPYWKLRAICSDTQRCSVAALAARDAFMAAQQKQAALLTEYGLDAKAETFTLDDDTLTITFPDATEASRANPA
jgi:hypothetical protein